MACEDLVMAVLTLMNRIKIDKFDSYRGIFKVQVFRNILERLIYNDEYATIDANLTDCNVGARKKRNVRDNLFVLNAIMNDAVNGSKEAKDISIYDVEKCFDALWLDECINDMFEVGLQNDKLNLLYLMNEHAQIAVRTPSGITERFTLEKIIMQGKVWGSLFCTVTMNKLGKLKYAIEDMLFKLTLS